jgi:adenylate cyclase
LEPSVLGPLLNEYLSGMTDIVFAHDGTVAKIVGDALHVLFGAPGEQPDHADRAVACALALDDYAQSFRERCRKKAIALGVTRIGAHAGPAIVGNFGGTGDAVSNFSFIMRLAPPALHVAHKIWRDEIIAQRAPPR